MKKFFTLLVAALFSFNAFADDVVTAKVSGTNLNIGLENETSFVAFQMDITLPDGITASSVTKTGRLESGANVTINGVSTATPFEVAYNVIGGNVVRVIAYNLGNNTILGATGDILNIVLSKAPVSADAISVDNIKFVKADELQEVDFNAVKGESGRVLGDINKSGEVNLNDLICMVKILQLGAKDPACAEYDIQAADVNQSGDVNLNDLVALIAKL